MRALAAAAAPLPIAVAGAFLALLTGEPATVLLLSSPALLALVLRRRLTLSLPAQVLVLLGSGIAAVGLTALAPLGQGLASEPLRDAHRTLAAGALLLAGLRLHLHQPFWGLPGTLGAGLLVFLAGGTVQSGRLYPWALLAFAVLAFVALRLHGLACGERQARAGLERRTLAATMLLLVLAGGLALSLSLAIPRLYAVAYQWALRFVGERPISGFHDGPLRLGSLEDLLESREIVARIEGDAGEQLRGNVYTVYHRGRWLAAEPREPAEIEAAAIAEGGSEPLAEIRYAVRDLDRFLLPVRAGRLQLRPRTVRVDRMGVVRLEADAPPERARLLAGDRRAFPAAAPEAEDLALPDDIAAELRALATEWTAGAGDAAARVAALRLRLESAYRYDIDVPELQGPGRRGRALRDPLLVFLLEARAGHCEYFASALTLLARAVGVPARLVTGYRVAERNPWGDYAIVRELHAHAWSEVHLDGFGWQALDPSPLRGRSLEARERTPLLAGVIDYAVVLAGERGAEVLLVLLVLLLAALQLWRILAARRAARGGPAVGGPSPPPAPLEALLAALADAGLRRAEAESLESLAGRARAQAQARPALSEASLLLRRWAALRYGGLGEAATLERDVARWISRARGADALR